MALPRKYIEHLEREWRIVAARFEGKDNECVLCLSFAVGENTVIHDRINLKRDAQRFAEFEYAVGDYGELSSLLDRRIGIVFDDRFGKAIIGYAPTFHPLTSCWPRDGLH